MTKNNITIGFIAIFLFSLPVLQAQNTGFMGKRFIFSMSAEVSPAWGKPSFADNSKNWYTWHSFNYTLSPHLEVIAWRLGMAGVSYHYFKTKFYYSDHTKITQTRFEGEVIVSWELDYSPVRDNLEANGFGLFYKQYLGYKSRAPMGTFLKLQLDGFFYKVLESDAKDAPRITDHLFALKLEFGHDLLFFNTLHLSTGLSVGLPFGGYKTFPYGGLLNGYDDITDASVSDYAKGRIMGHYLVGFTLSIGFIPF
jgi:hypothetical protein